MRGFAKKTVSFIFRFLLKGLLVAFTLLIEGCSVIPTSKDNVTPFIIPFEGAPVTVTIHNDRLVIANNRPDIIYYRIFPTEILPVIEWSPCMAPEVCPAEQQVNPGEEKQIALKTIVGDDTQSITLFWWRYLEKRPGASVPPMEMEEIEAMMP